LDLNEIQVVLKQELLAEVDAGTVVIAFPNLGAILADDERK